MKNTKQLYFAFVFLGFLTNQIYAQDVPSKISYQGVLFEDGIPFTGTKNFTFKIGTWTETQNDISITAGRYNVILGAVNPLSVSNFEGMATVFLEITVNETNLSPSIDLLTVPYAFYAQKAKTAEAADNASPIGTIVAFGGTTPPTGWLLCDGATVNRTTYADLFAVIQTNFGAGDASTTFHLPDFRGRFLRMVDGTASIDPDKTSRTAMNAGGNTGNAIGSVQSDELASHNHGVGTLGGSTSTNGNHSHTTSLQTYEGQGWFGQGHTGFSRDPYPKGVGSAGTSAAGNHSHSLNITGNTANQGGNETRPENAYVNYIIKYQ